MYVQSHSLGSKIVFFQKLKLFWILHRTLLLIICRVVFFLKSWIKKFKYFLWNLLFFVADLCFHSLCIYGSLSHKSSAHELSKTFYSFQLLLVQNLLFHLRFCQSHFNDRTSKNNRPFLSKGSQSTYDRTMHKYCFRILQTPPFSWLYAWPL